ncbi:MAG: DedA family protein [Alphaproteobacteria bacterium]|nr:DedA family protein [Alphaproteobacteria bacterium]
MLHKTYNWIMSFASHPRAVWVVSLVSFAESSFFPFPPDPLLIAMILKHRENAWRLAFIGTITSVMGGLVGYAIGYGIYETVGEKIISWYGLQEAFENFTHQFDKYGFWVIALKGLTPIPYKIVTISSGIAGYDIWKFLLASIIARSFRFYLLAALLKFYGPPIKDYIDNNLRFVTTASLAVLVGGFFLFKYVVV